MPKWLQIVIVIIVFFTVAGFYERWRVKAMDAWCRARGFTRIHPFVPADHPSITKLVSQFTRRDGLTRRYASGIAGTAGDTKITFVEFDHLPSVSGSSKWFTMAAWPAANPVAQPLVLAPRGTAALDEVVRMVKGTEGSLSVVADPAARQAWVTEKRRRALEAWEHGGKFVLVDGYVGWVTEGLLTPSRVDQLLAQVAEARRAIE